MYPGCIYSGGVKFYKMADERVSLPVCVWGVKYLHPNNLGNKIPPNKMFGKKGLPPKRERKKISLILEVTKKNINNNSCCGKNIVHKNRSPRPGLPGPPQKMKWSVAIYTDIQKPTIFGGVVVIWGKNPPTKIFGRKSFGKKKPSHPKVREKIPPAALYKGIRIEV